MTNEPEKTLWWRVRWMEAVWQSDLKPLEKLVASVYADHAGDQKMAWVTLARLRDRSGLSRDAANRALKGVRENGWLVVLESARQHRATVYMLQIPDSAKISSSTPAVPLDTDSSTGDGPLEASSSTPRVASSTSDDTSSTSRVPNPSSDQSSNPSSSSSPARQLTARLLGWGEEDERLDLLDDFLTARNVDSAQAWLTKCHRAGDLERIYLAFVNSQTWPGDRTVPKHLIPKCPTCNAPQEAVHYAECPDQDWKPTPAKDPWATSSQSDFSWEQVKKPTTEEYLDRLHELVGTDETDRLLEEEADAVGVERDSWLAAKYAWIRATAPDPFTRYAKEAS